MRIRDEFGAVFESERFVAAFAHRGGPSVSPGMLALVSVLQYAERLTDRQAADAVRGRIDWKYALGLQLADPGFDFSVLSEFRDRLIAHGLEQQILDAILAQCSERGLLRAGGRARTDSTHVIACIRDLNRLEFVTETMRCALEALAVAAPAWLAGTDAVNTDWLARYRQRADSYRLPKGEAERTAFAENVGGDGYELLDSLDDPTTPAHLADLEAVVLLRTVWAQEYQRDARGVRWRGHKQRPPGAARIVSPHDVDARCGVKRGSAWDGYKTHLTESCDDDLPHLITCTATTPATTDDHQLTAAVHQALTERGLKPAEHYVDGGYTSAKIILQARALGVEVIGPVKQAGGRPALQGSGYAATDFRIDWHTRQATCPQGQVSTRWSDTTIGGEPRIHIDFSRAGCTNCPAKDICTTAAYRVLTLLPREEHELLQQRRAEQQTEEWKKRYHTRAGVEGSISQAVRRTGTRRTRYRGLAKTSLAQVLTAAALNLYRLDAWWTGTPLGTTRISHYEQLALSLAA
ncbi:transposase IS4 family protein [Streptomyces bingchenggensis BCW-1]|uniref:Transposase IS4 family protein n=3 Tax=Streptomyces TaxID=1883 RepID=D7BUE8_STRBB|nr:transposase IS4 family protein [Streptomyces bingchenggensis BCW-1]